MIMGVLIKVFNFFRVGFYHGYRVQKGGQKIFEEDALQNKTLGDKYDTETKKHNLILSDHEPDSS